MKEALTFLQEVLQYEFIQTSHIHISLFSLITASVIIGAAWGILYLVKKIIYSAKIDGEPIDRAKAYTIVQVIKYTVYIITTVILIESMGADVSILIASSAALFVGIGLGLQNIFRDIVSGIFLLFEQSVKVGDLVEVEKLLGRVTEIKIRTSRIKTRDNIVIIVPNSQLIGQNVINWTVDNKTTRFSINVGVAYGSDTQLVKRLLEEVAVNHKDVVKTEKPTARFVDFGDSALQFELLFWTNHNWEVEFVKSDLRFKIDQLFRENGVQIPFPQRDLHIRSGYKD